MANQEIGPIIVGVDGSSASKQAVSIGAYVAYHRKAELQLVHATKDIWVSARRAVAAAASSISASTGPGTDADVVAAAHANLAAHLAKELPEGVTREIRVESGRAGPVLQRMASATGAELIVIGGKHHSTFGRWLGGSTAHYLARNARCPVLVTTADATTFSRVLVALDLSDQSKAVLAAAERLATAVHGALRIIHVVEESNAVHAESASNPVPVIEKLIHEIAHSGTEYRVVRGDVWPEIQSQIEAWDADVLVVGSHGLGFENQQLLGRLCEECLNDLPTSTLIVPLEPAGNSRPTDDSRER